MKRFLLLAGLLFASVVGTVNRADAALIAYWNFNTLSIATASPPGSGGVPLTIGASSGTGSLSLAAWGGNVDDFGGTTLNALFGDAAEESLSLISAGPSGGPFPGNGSYIEISFSMAGFQAIDISMASRGTSTGFNTGQWSYSTDGTTFTNFGSNTGTTSTSFAVVNPGSTTGLDNAATAYLRYTLSGATSNSGNNRIDNLQINAIAVPEPTAMLLVGSLAGLIGFKRRRS
jgi:hypothetical protein